MPRYAALLRAINVGGHVVKMPRLRTEFEALGFGGVATYIASGNVLFDAAGRSGPALERRIAAALERALGYAVAAFVRTPSELAVAAAHAPFADFAPGDALYVGFLARALTATEAGALRTAFAGPSDDFAAHGRELFWRCRGRSSDSAFTLKKFERLVGIEATFRNVSTVRALDARLSAPDPGAPRRARRRP